MVLTLLRHNYFGMTQDSWKFLQKLKMSLVNWLLVLLTTSIGLLLLPIEKQMSGWFLFVAHVPRRLHCMKAKDFEQKFDENYDITAALDLSKAKRVLQEQKRVNVDFPTWMIESLDREARKLGVTRQSIIKVWLAERLQKSDLTHRPSGDS